VIDTHEHAGGFKVPQRSFHGSETIPLPKCRLIRHNSHYDSGFIGLLPGRQAD